MAFPIGFVPVPRDTSIALPSAARPSQDERAAQRRRSSVRLRLIEGQDRWVTVRRAGLPGDPDELSVRSGDGEVLRASPADLAEVIECATGVHYGRAERLADQALRELG